MVWCERPRFKSWWKTLGEAARGKEWFIFAGVHPNPVEEDVREVAAAFRANHCDAVIAIGGGSPLDAGKAARLLVKRPDLDFARFYEESDGPAWPRSSPSRPQPARAARSAEARSSRLRQRAARPFCSTPNCSPGW